MSSYVAPVGKQLETLRKLLCSDAVAARTLAEAGCHQRPSNAMQLLLAMAVRRSGDPAGAIVILDRLLLQSPGAWAGHFEQGIALATMGDIAGGRVSLRRTLSVNANALLAAHALHDLSFMVGERGNDGSFAAALTAPAFVEACMAFLKGDPLAHDTLVDRFGIDPCDISAACLVAQIGEAAGLHDAVAALLVSALQPAPGYGPASFRLALALHRSGQDIAALDTIDRFLIAVPDLPAALSLRAAILMTLGREEAAVAVLHHATTIAGEDARVWQSYGHALRAVGRRDEALAAYRGAIRRAPLFGEAYWSIADLKTGALLQDEIAAMAACIDQPGLDDESLSYFHFALGRAHEDAATPAIAFGHYRRANGLRRRTTPYDADAQDDFVRRTAASLDARFFADRAGSGNDAMDPIFVVGMPRSGSSLVEQILASHPAVEGASELPDLRAIARGIAGTAAYPDVLSSLSVDRFAAVGADYLDRTRHRRRTDRPRFVDKFPGNFLHAGLIHLALPNARIIDIRRDPRDCCVSLYAQSFAAGQGYSYDLADLGHYYASYVALMHHFDTVLPGRIVRVDYETLIADPECETRRLLDRCRLDWDPVCLRFFETRRAVRTASSEQVRQPLHRKSIGRWQRFEPWLGPLFDALNQGPGALAHDIASGR